MVRDVDLVIGTDGAYSQTRAQLQKAVRMDFMQSYIDHGYVELCMPPDPVTGGYQMSPVLPLNG